MRFNLHNKSLFVLIIIQIGIVILLIGVIRQRNNTLGVSVNMEYANRRSVTSNPESNLKYFYEPEPLSVEYPPTEVSWYREDMAIKTNSDTLNDDEIDMSKNRHNIIALGDSFTYGEFVKKEDNWVERLEQALQDNISSDLQTINLGVKGYDIEYSVERYKIRGQKYHPQLILWLLKSDDFGSVAEVLTPIIMEEEQKVSNLENPDDKYVSNGPIGGPKYINRAIERMMALFEGKQSKLLMYQKKRIQDIRKYYSGHVLLLCLDPQENVLTMLKDLEQNDDKMLAVLLPNIYEDSTNFFPDQHPTSKGHKVIADFIFDYLNTHKQLISNE